MVLKYHLESITIRVLTVHTFLCVTSSGTRKSWKWWKCTLTRIRIRYTHITTYLSRSELNWFFGILCDWKPSTFTIESQQLCKIPTTEKKHNFIVLESQFQSISQYLYRAHCSYFVVCSVCQMHNFLTKIKHKMFPYGNMPWHIISSCTCGLFALGKLCYQLENSELMPPLSIDFVQMTYSNTY